MQKRKKMAVLILAMVILSLSWACGGGGNTNTTTPTNTTNASPAPAASPASSPAPAATPAATVDVSKEAIAQIYTKNCQLCHGADGKGLKTISPDMPDFTDAKWQADESDQELYETIANGDGKMPKWTGILKEEEMRALVQHVRTYKK